MHERKQYPNLSDEELDRRGEEALRRMLANPPKQPGQGQNQQQKKQRHRRRHK